MVGRRYKDLEIYKKSYELALKIHDMTSKLPKNELYEEGYHNIKKSKKYLYNTN
jgi:hypothetical protein